MDRRIILTSLLVLLLLAGASQATTYYVSKSGNDSNSGTGWATAWTSITKVNSSVASGDTVFFGTGIWRGTTLEVVAGSYSDRTTYACSSFVDVNGSGQQYFAQIWGSDSLSGWSQYNGNIYRTPFAGYGGQLFQGDSALWRQTSLGAVTGPGKWYYDGVNIYLWAYGGGTPQDRYDIENAQGAAVDMGALSKGRVGQDYVTLYGLRIKYADTRLVELDYIAAADHYDSVFFERCHLSHVMGDQGANPGLIYAGGGADASLGDYNRIRACSLGYAWAIDPNTFQSTGNKGSGIIYYKQRHLTIDSNTFYGFFKEAAIFFKAAYGPQGAPFSDSNVIAYNRFENYQGGKAIGLFGIWRYLDVYGNIFDSISIGLYSYPDNKTGSGFGRFYNNTFYKVDNPIFSQLTGAGSMIAINNEFKYNVMYHTGNQEIALNNAAGDSGWTVIDSNMYFTGGSLTFRKDGNGGAYVPAALISLASWQSIEGFDQNSFFNIDPGFADRFGGDFRRLSASGEMWNIFHNDTFTVFGAPQPDGDTIPPNQIIDLGVINITDSSATIKWTSSYPSTSQVKYGISPSLNLATSTDPSYLSSHSVNLSSLQPNATYAYQSVSIDTLNRVKYSSVKYFQTLVVADTTGPLISSVTTSQITNSTATISWGTNEPATSQVDYGTSSPPTQSTTLVSNWLTSHGVGLSGLSAGTTYFFRVRSRDAQGNETLGGILSFTTTTGGQTDTTPPVISSIIESAITISSVKIDWVTDEPATSVVEFGTSATYGQSFTNNGGLVLNHTLTLNSLLEGTLYHYRAVSTDGSGNISYGIDRTFQTSSTGGSPPVNLALGITPTVDATYAGYAPNKLTDGSLDPFGLETTTWVSEESVSNPHWIELDFGSNKTILQVDLFWGWNVSRSEWMTSRRIEIDAWNGTGYDSVAYISSLTPDSITVVNIGGVATSRIRIYQSPNQGPAGYPTVLWLAELEVWGNSLAPGSDTGSLSPSLQNTYAYPNPFQPSLHGSLIIDQIPTGASLIILDVAGNTIRRFPDIQSGSVAWDGRNESSSNVSSGVYLWYLENSGQKGKIVLVN